MGLARRSVDEARDGDVALAGDFDRHILRERTQVEENAARREHPPGFLQGIDHAVVG